MTPASTPIVFRNLLLSLFKLQKKNWRELFVALAKSLSIYLLLRLLPKPERHPVTMNHGWNANNLLKNYYSSSEILIYTGLVSREKTFQIWGLVCKIQGLTLAKFKRMIAVQKVHDDLWPPQHKSVPFASLPNYGLINPSFSCCD